MRWPQGSVIGLLGFGLCVALLRDGQPRAAWSFADALMSTAVFGLLLHAGGFWR